MVTRKEDTPQRRANRKYEEKIRKNVRRSAGIFKR